VALIGRPVKPSFTPLQPGVLGQHNIRRSSLAVSEGHADVLFWQAQATLRTPCFADHFIQRVPCACRGGHDDINCSRIHSASQTVQASMRINVLPTVKAQGGAFFALPPVLLCSTDSRRGR